MTPIAALPLESVKRPPALSDEERAARRGQNRSKPVGPLAIGRMDPRGLLPGVAHLSVDVDGTRTEGGIGLGDDQLVLTDQDGIPERSRLGEGGHSRSGYEGQGHQDGTHGTHGTSGGGDVVST